MYVCRMSVCVFATIILAHLFCGADDCLSSLARFDSGAFEKVKIINSVQFGIGKWITLEPVRTLDIKLFIALELFMAADAMCVRGFILELSRIDRFGLTHTHTHTHSTRSFRRCKFTFVV